MVILATGADESISDQRIVGAEMDALEVFFLSETTAAVAASSGARHTPESEVRRSALPLGRR